MVSMTYPRKIFNSQDIKLQNIYNNINSSYNYKTLDSKKIKDVYGDILFAESPKNRPYLHASFVSSIDGKINFSDIPNGSLIAKYNQKDPNGGLADFWVMNMLRSLSDAVIIGSGTLRDEPNITGHIFDEELEQDRIKAGKTVIPVNIIVSQSARTIPFNHKIFKSNLSLVLITSKSGSKYAQYYSEIDTYELPIYTNVAEVENHKKEIIEKYNQNKTKLVIIATSNEDAINNVVAMKILKILGLNYISVEASYYTHALIKDKILDEIFLNYSGIYVGGSAMGIAKNEKPFTTSNFPHVEMLSIHMHSPFFMYTRQKFIYE